MCMTHTVIPSQQTRISQKINKISELFDQFVLVETSHVTHAWRETLGPGTDI